MDETKQGRSAQDKHGEAAGDPLDRSETLVEAAGGTPPAPQPLPGRSVPYRSRGDEPTFGEPAEGDGGRDWIGVELIARYPILREIGRGGMGVVYLAEDCNLGEQVVVKRPHDRLLGHAAAVSRFLREVKSLIRLRHAHICLVRDAGQHAGTPFVVMDYLAGGSLLDRRPKKPDGQPAPMTVEQVLAWLPGVAEALDFVHGEGFVHRDVKPGNILFDDEGNAHLTDFGIAKALAQGDQPDDAPRTGEGVFLGTPEYTAPEVFAGGEFGGIADQYSLAVVVYEMLGGRRPFEGPTAFAIVQKQSTTIPTALHALNRAAPEAVSQAVFKALSSLPEDRYANCREFAQAVARPSRPRPPKAKESVKPLPVPPAPGIVEAPRKAAPRVVQLKLPDVVDNSIGMKMVLIPAGEFLMGSPESDQMAYGAEKPQHRVRITKPFYLGIYPVTQREYQQVMGSNPSHFKGNSNRPVERVSWDEAQEFCRRLSALPEEKAAGAMYRLPTEAEWEYACRAGTTTRWCFGDDERQLGEFAWFDKNSGGHTHPVGQKKPNGWRLYDMHGNVWEWCEDWFGNYAKTTVDDSSGPQTGADRVIRGGGWFHDPGDCRAASRRDQPGTRRDSLGFRLTRVLAGG